MRSLLFVHVPKTAGTSFRVALENELGTEKVFKDYAMHSPVTSDVIRKHVYEKGDVFSLFSHEPMQGLLLGHFHLAKYHKFYQPENIVTFVREPIARVISEYHHFQRHNDFQGSLIEFAEKRRNKNLMSRFLGGVPWPMIGFAGISEQYDDSLELFNKLFEQKLPVERLNVAPKKKLSLTEEEQALLNENNKEDEALYRKLLKTFTQRRELAKAGKVFVRGAWRSTPKKAQIEGFAYIQGNESPVTLEVYKAGKLQETLTSNQANNDVYLANGPRKGYVGFTYRCPVKQHKRLKVVVAETGQELFRGY